MDKLTQLHIRACKSRDPYTRLKTLRRRFYLEYDRNATTITLSLICEEYIPIPLSKLVADLQSTSFWRCGMPVSDLDLLLLYKMISTIRLAPKDCFPGLTPPIKFK